MSQHGRNTEAGLALPPVVTVLDPEPVLRKSTASARPTITDSSRPQTQESRKPEITASTSTEPLAQHDAADEDVINPPVYSRSHIAITMSTLCLAVFVAALDVTIVTTALPSIAGTFSDASEGYVWIGSAFILAYTALQPVWGSIADIWGRRPIMLAAAAIFFVGSLVCSTVGLLDVFLLGRAIQGLGAAGMATLVNIIISDMFSLRDRALYFAMTSVVWAIASAIGPVMGGVFAARVGWRWCFWINLPISAVVFAVCFFTLRLPSPRTPVLSGLRAIDWPGSVLIVGGTLMFLLGLDFGGVRFAWASPNVIGLIVAGIVAIAVFAINEWKFAKHPIVPLRLFSTLSTASAYGVFFLDSFVFMGIAYYLPLYSQSVLGADALTSGLFFLPFIASLSIVAALSGVYIQKAGAYRPPLYLGHVIMTLGVGLFLNLEFERNVPKFIGFQILAGIGVGLNIEAPIIAAQANVHVRDTAVVVATMGFTRSIASAVSVVAGGVAFQNMMTAQNGGLVEIIGSELARHFNGDSASADVGLIETLGGEQQVVVRLAYYNSMRTMWIMYTAVAGLASLLSLCIGDHHLTREVKGAVIGLDRDKAPVQMPSGAFTRVEEKAGDAV